MKVLIYPKGDNPYQELLYAKLRVAHPENSYDYLPATRWNILFFPFIAVLKRLQGYRVFHMHWLVFWVNRPIPGIRFFSFIHSLICLTMLRLAGYRIIWTVHNVLPHQTETTNDRLIVRYMSRVAHEKIIHSSSVIQTMQQHGLDTSNTTIIPHGNYVGVYANTMSRQQARQALNLPPDAFVALFFGRIDPYKNLDVLVQVAEAIIKEKPNFHLVIAGKPTNGAMAELVSRAAAQPNVHSYDTFIADNDVQVFFKAADVAVCPFQEITTSGSVILSLSFGCPVIAPAIGTLQDMPPTIGWLYSPNTANQLRITLQQAVGSTELAKKRSAAEVYARSLDWSAIAAQTAAVYDMPANNRRRAER